MRAASFIFSIVMPVYNVKDYLEYSIESLLSQTLDFKKNVQLILVNDGSLDGSGVICENYAEEYPDNIIYVEQENQGVSVARNTGIELAKGTYINFLDSDDYFESDTLEKVYYFLSKYKEEIDLVAIPLIFFEGKQGPHMLHHKFEESRVIDVVEEPDKFVMQSGSTFIHRKRGLGKLRFKAGQKFGEDASLLIDIVMKKKKYGVLNTTRYNYRARIAGTSALQSSKESYDYYIPFFDLYLIPKLEKYKNEFGEVPKYVQNVIMYDLQWRLRSKVMPEVIKPDIELFYSKVINILSYIDEEVIIEQRYLNWYQKHAICNMKQKNRKFNLGDEFYESTITKTEEDEIEDLVVIDKNEVLVDRLNNRHLQIDLCEIENGNFKMVGRIGSLLPQKNLRVYIVDSLNQKHSSSEFRFPLEDRFLVGEIIYKFTGFAFLIPFNKLREIHNLKVILEVEGIQRIMPLKFSPSARLSNRLINSYLVIENSYMMQFDHDKKQFNIAPYSHKNMLKQEMKIKKEMKKKKVKNFRKISRTRILVRTIKRNKRHSINLYMDRIDKADDSAEVLFKYVIGLAEPRNKNYFVLNEDSSDYRRLSKEFDLVGYKSNRHKILFLLADKLVSTHCDRFIYQPFTGTENYFKDLKEYKFVFLQHGIIKDDMSKWLKSYDKNFKLFITSSNLEYKSIIEGNYSFTKKEVKLTGLPRFDRLTDTSTSSKMKILVMPTWRQSIVEEFSDKINARPYSEDFKQTVYFKKWNEFLNDEKLLNYTKNTGIEIVFVPHPSIRQQLTDFDLSKVTLASYEESYSSLLKQGNILVTDYSSVYFDFAYMKKPIFYYHFDKGNWESDTSYFSYEEMGFGEITSSHDELVNKIINNIDCESKMPEVFKDRVDKFYKYTDQNNSKRVHLEISKL